MNDKKRKYSNYQLYTDVIIVASFEKIVLSLNHISLYDFRISLLFLQILQS
jgi:hypothetical protein